MSTSTAFFPEVERVAKNLFERRMKVAGADQGRRASIAPREVDRREMALFWELEDYYARLAEEEWEANAARRM